MIDKKEVAAQLEEVAVLLEVLGEDQFRSRSYRNAARSLDQFDGDFELLLAEKRFTELRGVGAGLGAELEQLAETGILPILVELLERVPAEVRELFKVSGLGAKRVALLWQNDITGVTGLIAAAESGRLAKLPGLGPKSAAGLLASARFVLDAQERMGLNTALALAEELTEALLAELPGLQVFETGEVRRRLETVGRVELLVTGATPAELLLAAERLFDADSAEQQPSEDVNLTVLHGTVLGRKAGLLLTKAEELGSRLFLTTGSVAYLAELPESVSLEPAAAATETEFLAPFGLEPVAPELREAPLVAPPARLLTEADIRGLVHMHTTWSDGTASIREMTAEARRLGFSYLGLADHSRTSYYANGLTIERVEAQIAEVAEVRAELQAEGSDFQLLHGLEVDILSDGTLDYPDELLARLDYTVVSVHQNFTLNRKAQTERVIAAVHNPHATILGHPTGRLLLRRPGYEIDLDAVIAACAETGTVIEINANPWRLDLDWRWARKAAELGCAFAVNTDAHSFAGFQDLEFGVAMARKAGLSAEQVVVTELTGSAFLARLKTAGR